jgi:hypothetical protein
MVLSMLAVESVPHHQRAEMVLTRDIPKQRRRDRPPPSDSTTDLDEIVEVLTRWAQPVGVGVAQTVGLLTHEVGRAHRRFGPHQTGRFAG